jgi:hypothetical protein
MGTGQAETLGLEPSVSVARTFRDPKMPNQQTGK